MIRASNAFMGGPMAHGDRPSAHGDRPNPLAGLAEKVGHRIPALHQFSAPRSNALDDEADTARYVPCGDSSLACTLDV
jgi:hypothetical protein